MLRNLVSLASQSLKKQASIPTFAQSRQIIVNYRPDAELGNSADAATMITQLDTDLLSRLKSTDTLKRKVPSTPSKRFWLRLDRSELWKGRYVFSLVTFTQIYPLFQVSKAATCHSTLSTLNQYSQHFLSTSYFIPFSLFIFIDLSWLLLRP